MVANQTEIKRRRKSKRNRQYRRMKDSTWRFIMKERLKIERPEQKLIYKWWRIGQKLKKAKSKRNWSIQANERFNVAIHRERKAENRKTRALQKLIYINGGESDRNKKKR